MTPEQHREYAKHVMIAALNLKPHEWRSVFAAESLTVTAETFAAVVALIRTAEVEITWGDEPQSTDVRCGWCDHLAEFHQVEGCWYTVTAARNGANMVCPCANSLPKPANDEPTPWRMTQSMFKDDPPKPAGYSETLHLPADVVERAAAIKPYPGGVVTAQDPGGLLSETTVGQEGPLRPAASTVEAPNPPYAYGTNQTGVAQPQHAPGTPEEANDG